MIDDRNEGIAAGEPPNDEGSEPILMESGSIRPDGDDCEECQVRRGMPAISTDGHEVGWIAAVMIDAAGQSTGILMARPHATLEYYHLPLRFISSVCDGRVRLRIRAEAARSLPRRNERLKSE
jgi:hypothetical protein